MGGGLPGFLEKDELKNLKEEKYISNTSTKNYGVP
jgi:hypothetical protein